MSASRLEIRVSPGMAAQSPPEITVARKTCTSQNSPMNRLASFVVRNFCFGSIRINERKKHIRRMAEKAGVQVYRGNLTWPNDEDFLRGKARNIKGIPDARCFFLQSVIRDLASVPGDVAECGVRFGKSTAFLLEADRAKRTYHLFDSFEGVSEPVAEDIPSDGKCRWVKHELIAPEEMAVRNLKDFTNVRFYKGWIPDRFPEVSDCVFALLHLDVDLYQPSVDALEYFWPRLSVGGVVICDDYGSFGCPGAKKAMDAFFADKKVRFIELPTAQALVIKIG